jgi:glycosyltransferase involved in cell wall biosynthesis
VRKPVKIAVLADSPLAQLKKGCGGRDLGASTWLPQIAAQFAARPGFEFFWISFVPGLPEAQREVYEGITYFAYPKIRWQVDDLAGLIPSKLLLRWVLSGIRPDVLHAWGSERTYASAISRNGIPSIFSLQGLLRRCQEVGGLPQHLSWRLATLRERRFVNSASIVTAESQWAISGLREYYSPRETRMVEYGVHPSFYTVSWQPKQEEPCFVFVGSLTELKGIPTLVKAVKKCRTRGWRLYLIGEGPLKNWVKDQKLEQTICMGMLGWEDLQRKLSKAWALIHPTTADSSPNSVKEARVIGLPVITTKEGGQSGYIQHEENGIIVPASDPNALALAIDLLAENFAMVKSLGRMHHERDREYFRPEKTSSAFCDIYLELAQRRSSASNR